MHFTSQVRNHKTLCDGKYLGLEILVICNSTDYFGTRLYINTARDFATRGGTLEGAKLGKLKGGKRVVQTVKSLTVKL